MRVAITGASGLIGSRIGDALRARGDEVVAVSLRSGAPAGGWAESFAGVDGVVHLAGEPVAQRWTDKAREGIRSSRVEGTRALVEALAAADPSPRVLVSASAVGYYGSRGDERLDESSAPGDDFLAQVCVGWEREAQAATDNSIRVVNVRTGVVLAKSGGALAKMLLPFRLGIGGPVAGGRQYLPWIHIDDLVGIYVAALDNETWSGPVNASAPEPVTNAAFSKALGRALHRPAVAPVPAFAIRLLYGDMAEIVTEGQRAIPARPLELGYTFAHPDLDEALADALR
jgi:hypothetical protein